MRPKFSIVIPTIGRLDLIKRALYSALRQQDHFDDYEIVVLDNCSEDGTWDYLQSINNPRLKTFRNSHRLLLGQNWNKAVRLSSGEFIYILQDDNIVLPEMLATISNAMARHRYVDLVCFARRYMDEDERILRGRQLEREELLRAPQGLMGFARNGTTGTSFMVFSRTVFDRYGEFDEESSRYPTLLDIEFRLRWMLHCDILIIPDFLAMHRRWSDTATTSLTSVKHWSEIFTAMTYTVDRVLRFSVDSGRLDSDQLDELREALVQRYLLDFFRNWGKDWAKDRSATPKD